MAKFIILQLCIAALSGCEAGLIPSELVYSNFPNLKTVHHGHGATSYQNVQVQNFGSVPIPKELQVDDGNEHLHSQYLHEVVADDEDIESFQHQDYAEAQVAVNRVVVSAEAPHEIEEQTEPVESEPHHLYTPSNYEHYDDEAEYEYH